jgi:hypothetical protein
VKLAAREELLATARGNGAAGEPRAAEHSGQAARPARR